MYKEPKKSFLTDRQLYLRAFFIALAVAAAFFIPFLIADSGIFLFYGDYNVQQIPFYQLAHDAIRSGNVSYNLYTDLGADFIGSYSFYLLGSPFFWLTIPFSSAMVPYLMAPLFCLKFAVASLTACAYIKRFVTNKNYALIGGLLYAFSGFGIYNIFFNHFHEVIAFFPLLLLSLELFVEEKRRGLFAFTVCLCALCNYFFFFGEVVFVIIYFFVRLASSKTWRLSIGSFLCLALEAVLGLLMSAVLLMPAVITVLSNPRVGTILDGWNLVTYSNVQRYFAILECLFLPPDIPARPNFFPDANAKWSSLGAWLPLFGMCGVITFMQTHKGHFIKRILGISLVMALIPGLNSLFFALNDAYYARWFFMPVLLMAGATVIALERCTDRELNAGVRWSLGITAAFCALGFLPDKQYEKWVLGLVEYPERLWMYAAIALVCILLTVFAVNIWRHRRNGYRIITVFVCLASFVVGAVFIAQGKSHSYDEDFIIDNAIYGAENIKLDKKDGEFFRIDVYDGMDNLPMFWRLPSIQAFHSVVPESVMRFYTALGIERDVASRPEPSYYALRTLTSCKYLFIERGYKDPEICYGFEWTGVQNGFDVYENRFYVPIGWAYNYYCDKNYFDDTTESFRDRLMLQSVYLSDEQIAKYSKYMSELPGDTFPSQSTLKDDTDALRSQCADNFIETKTGFESSITLEKPNLVFYSIPYGDGWSATVNGKKAEIEQVNESFMAVLCEAGENKIVFTYKTPGLSTGIIITLCAVAAFLLYMLLMYLYRKHHSVKSAGDTSFDELEQMVNQNGDTHPRFMMHSQNFFVQDENLPDESLKFPTIDENTPDDTEDNE